MQKVKRPQAEKRKINSRNEFELCYLRHQYLRKVDYNPTEAEMRPYYHIIVNFGKSTFFTYRNLFGSVGVESEDIINVGKVHLVSYLGLFSLEQCPDKKAAFIQTFEVDKLRHPEEKDFLNKNKANFTGFLKQRYEDMVRICRQKVRNIKGHPSDDYYAYYGPEKPPKILPELLRSHESYGFRKIDIAVFKTIRKKAKAKGANIFKFNDNYYVSVKVENRNLDISDFCGAGLDPYDSIHNMSPDRIYEEQQSAKFWENKRVEFSTYSPLRKARTLKKFINQYKNKKNYEVEVKAARKMLKSMEART